MAECNETSVPKEADESNNDNQANRINAMIKELAKLRTKYHEVQKNRNYWLSQESSLLLNVALAKIKCENLEKRETDLKVSTSESTKQEEIVEQEIKNLISEKMLRSSEERDELRRNEKKYHNKFINALKEYSNESLSNDIKRYQEEYMKINNKLPELKKQLEDLEIQCGLHNLYNEEDPEIVKTDKLIKSIREDMDYKLRNTATAENMLKNLDKQIQDITEETQMLKNLQTN